MSHSVPFHPETSRRTFLRKGAAAAVALPALASILNACGKARAAAAPIARPNATAAMKAAALTARQKADAMDAMHEKRVKAFPARTAEQGNQLMEPRLEGGVKVYELTTEEIEWAVEPGRTVQTWYCNRQVPAPQVPVP